MVLPGAASRNVGRLLGRAAAATAVVALLLALVVAPPEAVQGESQRLMYLHVPAAWTAFLAFAVVWVASAAVLAGASPRWDAVAQGAAELGVAMTALCLLEGSIWGHAAWGVWWAWDPRLVTTAVLLVTYVGYLAVRGLSGSASRRARRSAVVGLVAFALVPVVHFSVLWWRTLHQPPTVLRPDLDAPIDPVMLAALLVSLLAFTLAGAWFVVRRVDAISQVARPSSSAAASPRETTPAGRGMG